MSQGKGRVLCVVYNPPTENITEPETRIAVGLVVANVEYNFERGRSEYKCKNRRQTKRDAFGTCHRIEAFSLDLVDISSS